MLSNSPYIASELSFNGDMRYVLFEITPFMYRLVEVAKSFEELMIIIDLKGYDRNKIQFSDELKKYDI